MRALYETLEIEKNASQDEIKSAYNRLAKLHHPDKNPNNIVNATIKFRAVHEAYKVLCDETKLTVAAKPSSAAYFQPNLSSEIEKLYEQFPDQLANAMYNANSGQRTISVSGLSDFSGVIVIQLSELSKEAAALFKKRISSIIQIPGEGWMVDNIGGIKPTSMTFGYYNAEKTKHFMELIEKASEKAFIDSLDSAKAFLQMSKTI